MQGITVLAPLINAV